MKLLDLYKLLDFTIALLCLCAYQFFIPQVLSQNSNCANVLGKSITWDSTWSADGNDHGVTYQVIRVSELGNENVVMLELNSTKPSFKKQRELLIDTNELMNKICRNFSSKKSDIDFQNNENFYQAEDNTVSESSELPFIKYEKGEWQRSDAPQSEKLGSCILLGKQFSCTISDRNRYANKLKELESEVKMMEKLGY